MDPERICPQCSYRTTLSVGDVCPVCSVPLVLQERTWAPTRRAGQTKPSPLGTGKLDGRLEATVRDLNISGARLEHGHALRSGWRYILAIPLRQDALPLHLPMRVVWSRLQRVQRGAGSTGTSYQSGVEFRELSAERERDLAAFLGGIGETYPGPLNATVASPRE